MSETSNLRIAILISAVALLLFVLLFFVNIAVNKLATDDREGTREEIKTAGEGSTETIYIEGDYGLDTVEFSDVKIYTNKSAVIECSKAVPVFDLTDNTPGETPASAFPYFAQYDSRWNSLDYSYNGGGQTIGTSGCGPVAVAMVIKGLLGDTVDMSPVVAAEFGKSSGNRVDGGTTFQFFHDIANKYNLKCEEIDSSGSSIKAALDAGRPVVISVGQGRFTSRGHYISAVASNADSILIYDPGNSSKSQYYTVSDFDSVANANMAFAFNK